MAGNEQGAIGRGRQPGVLLEPSTPLTISEVRVGETIYPLLQPVIGVVVRSEDGRVEFRADGLGAQFVGYGTDFDSAYRDWREGLHSAFQTLYKKVQFEMTKDEAERWTILIGAINVEAYSFRTPMRLRQNGHVSSVRPFEITWENGRVEPVSLDQAPREFAAFELGQWFEALLTRDPRTWKLRQLIDVELREPSQPLSGLALEDFWNSLASTTSLPESTERWTSLSGGEGVASE